jgi:uncharacterized protein YjhX (UPF0386 family)
MDDIEKQNTPNTHPETQNIVDIIAEFEWKFIKILWKSGDIKILTEEQINSIEISILERLGWKHTTVVNDFFKSLRWRRELVNNNTPDKLFSQVFWKTPIKKVIAIGTLFSLHFYVDNEDYAQIYDNRNSSGFYSKGRGRISVTQIQSARRVDHLDEYLASHDILWSDKNEKITLHELQHARYDIVKVNYVIAPIIANWIDETLAHRIEWRDTPHVKARLLWLDFFVKNNQDGDKLKNLYKSNSYVFWRFFYEYRRVMWNIVDFVDEFVDKMNRAEGFKNGLQWRQKAVDTLSMTPLWKWHTLLPESGWKKRDFLIKRNIESIKAPEEVEIQYLSFEKFEKPIRVINPPNIKQWNIIVIPSYDEWYDIIDAIDSVADQVESQRASPYNVMVVINNSSDTNDTIKNSNKKTMDLIENLWKWTYPDNLSGSIRRKMEKVMASGLRISVVDIFSDEESIQSNNVWYARDVWWYVATTYLENPWDYLIQIDADTKLDPTYLAYIRKENWFYAGQSGNVVFRYTHDVTRLKELDNLLRGYRYTLTKFRKMGISKIMSDEDEYDWVSWVSLYSGCNIAVSKQRFLDVWWFDHISGAEDVLFAMKVNNYIPWEDDFIHDINQVNYNENLTVYPKYRPSERTKKWHWHGHEVIKKLSFSESYWEFEVQSNESYLAQRGLEDSIEHSIIMGLWREEFVKHLQWWNIELTEDQCNKIYTYTRWMDLTIDKIWNHHHLTRLIEDIIGEAYPKVSLNSSLNTLLDELKSTYPDTITLLDGIKWENKDLKERLDFMNSFLDYYNSALRLSPLLDLVKEVNWIFEEFPILIYICWGDFENISSVDTYLYYLFSNSMNGLSQITGKEIATILQGYPVSLLDLYSKIKNITKSSGLLAMKNSITSWDTFWSFIIHVLQNPDLAGSIKALSSLKITQEQYDLLPDQWQKWIQEILSNKHYSQHDIGQLKGALATILFLYAMIIKQLQWSNGL